MNAVEPFIATTMVTEDMEKMYRMTKKAVETAIGKEIKRL